MLSTIKLRSGFVVSGNVLISVSMVALHQGWFNTGMGECVWAAKLSRYTTSHPGQLSQAIPLWVGTVNTSRSVGVNRCTMYRFVSG